MTQFLGTGSSGLFAMDHISTAKPYDVCGRAQALDDLAKHEADRDLISFGCRLDQRLQPQEPPNVKWVNWRWPRYEWEAEVLGVKIKVCRQWVVHGRAVLAQTTLQNLSETRVADLQCQYQCKMLIRDLDYVDPKCWFNEDSLEDGHYHRVQAPRGYGRITVHILQGSGARIGAQMKTEPPIDPERGYESEYEGSATRKSAMDEREASNVFSSGKRRDGLHPGQAEGFEHANEHMQDASRPEDLVVEAKTQNRQKKDTWSLEQTNSVASVMVAYQNGLAVKMDTEDTIEKIFQLGPKGGDADVYEIVTAYKLVPLPDREVHWRNLFLTPEEVDVSKILRQEKVKIWGESEGEGTGQASRNFALSGLNTSEDAQEGQKRANAAEEDTSTIDGTAAEGICDKTSPTDANMHRGYGTPADPKTDSHATSKPAPGSSGFSRPHGQPDGSSPKTHIEFLLWRHLEHILSVCSLPLRHFDLFEKRQPGNLRKQEVIALTCGDMSGHRVCTSAS